uniref:Helicase C-terminal domain-containing protein n=1 Tax=Rhizophora mucronata TaxID=61149 RepID=A0A2P2IWV1_RHIMU
MIQLRKNCNHPDLLESAFDGSYFYPPVEQIVKQCGKFKLLDRLLNRLFALKHKVLIFSQWTKILDIMEYYFSENGFEVCRIDGLVKLEERRRQIEEFNDVNSNYRIFLLSTRAGGLGINLTAADTCILYDSDWNPQMDLQAMDRCHRIGQTKPVHVYRLATAQSIEVLIFSQWTKILDIMEYYFSENGFEVCRIDGLVKLEERRRQIEEFNDVNSNYRIFLLSTRAGGLGINLTAADTCILYDSDWNPQMDLQAMDRCHRIGQTKPVHVYRLATAQSIEGRILKRAFSKLKLEHVVIEKGQFHQERLKSNTLVNSEEEEILALLKYQETAEDKLIQTDISDEDLDRVLDRSDMIAGSSDGKENNAADGAIPLKGPGWEAVIPSAAGGVLSTLNS